MSSLRARKVTGSDLSPAADCTQPCWKKLLLNEHFRHDSGTWHVQGEQKGDIYLTLDWTPVVLEANDNILPKC